MKKSNKIPSESKDEDSFNDSKTWKTALVGGGSNSFHQVNPKSFDLMTPVAQVVDVPGIFKEKAGFVDAFSTDSFVRLLSCGSNMSVVVVSKTVPASSSSKAKHDSIFMWGSAAETNSQLQLPRIISMKCFIRQISCGQSHIGCVSVSGEVYTWGSGNYGVLGHGNKNSESSPRRIDAVSKLKAVYISCGASHTGIIAAQESKIKSFALPCSALQQQEYAECGSLYVCGLGKAGQLGLTEKIPTSGFICTPKEVKSFGSNNLLAYRVSCGFHHTLVIAVSSDASANTFPSIVFSFGWGEHGRLGHGSEQKASTPAEVIFDEPSFHATAVSAGEQHSLASGTIGTAGGGGGGGACYSWGSNTLGQLGVGSSNSVPFACTPLRIPFPEGTEVTHLSAGGRHSCCLTGAGKVFTWGWNEEGQLGHGSESNACYPRMCHIPSIHGKRDAPLEAVSLGMAHSMALIRNPTFHYQRVEVVEKEEVPVVVPPPVIEVPPVVEEVPEVVTPPPPLEVVEEVVAVPSPMSMKALLVDEEDEDEEEYSKFFLTSASPVKVEEEVSAWANRFEESPVEEEWVEPQQQTPYPNAPVLFVQGIRELLLQREQRLAAEAAAPLVETKPMVEPILVPEEPTPKAPTASDKINIYYRDGQQLDNCLVANSAKRAMVRKDNKENKDVMKDKKVVDKTSSRSTSVKKNSSTK